jgi:excisionase family DNA binding protein
MDILLTAPEVAAWARLSKPTILRLVRQGDLSGRKLGNEWRFTIDDLRVWSHLPQLSVEDVKAAVEKASV